MENRYKRIAVEAALKSGHLIKKSVGKFGKVSYKGPDNIVTDVDKAAETMIIKKILSAFPDHSILSEEGPPRSGLSEYRWIIDPLDGTTNFAHGFPFFCVSIALEKDCRVILGVVYDPMRDELFYAEEGKGAYRNSKKICVSGTKKLPESFLATGFSYGIKGRGKNVRLFGSFLMRSLAIRRAGSAALDLCYVACGRFDGFWEMNLFPWDSAAGIVIIREAGGSVTRFNGLPFTPYDRDILATNNRIHNQMVKVLTA